MFVIIDDTGLPSIMHEGATWHDVLSNVGRCFSGRHPAKMLLLNGEVVVSRGLETLGMLYVKRLNALTEQIVAQVKAEYRAPWEGGECRESS
ncbi:hypothetical protein UFOVP823_41 [uncultured Caudovirales phage]|uniref:Uncharacterized protein n=1 Tax=uncultured Caudovirales phage TaxID=2100421 RepID=A0A6J5P868_9CAUD|nr:hypothetical protein UFOVP823_41 [uncultured Caudovirales phage]